MVYAQSRILLEIETLNSLTFWDTNGSPHPSQKTSLSDNYKKKKKKWRNCRLMDFVVPENQRVKIKESKKYKQILGPCQWSKNKQTMEREGNGDTNCSWCAWCSLQGNWNSWKLEYELRPFRLQNCWDRPEYSEESWRPEEKHATCKMIIMEKRLDKWKKPRQNRDNPTITIIKIC